MKLIDKLKNALFEEEYVEIEEKPKSKPKTKSQSKKEQKPIAKRIVATEKKDYIPTTREEDVELRDEDFEIPNISDRDVLTDKNDFKFPAMEEEIITETYHEESLDETTDSIEVLQEEVKLYQASKKESVSGPYGLDEDNLHSYDDYTAFEKEAEKTFFRPSPIISPIYGVLDKNYKKEEVVSKKEARTSPSFARDTIDVDSVRKKAFGTLSDEIEKGVEKEEFHDDIDFTEDNDLLVDLSVKEDTPEVKKVTVGDAEEYFEDLGLEYNVDYKDSSKKATGRRSDAHDYDEVETVLESAELDLENLDELEDIPQYVEPRATQDDEDNLFDLIDSMYEE